MEKRGIKELILTSQDTLQYGVDIYGKPALYRLICELLEHTVIPWIRLLYLSPDESLFDLFPLFDNQRLIPYFDVPVQHASKKVLRAMGRIGDGVSYRRVFDHIRDRVSRAVLRTTLLVGFPGENEASFAELSDFIQTVKFNHVGVFTFSPQEQTPAYSMQGSVETETAVGRKRRIMEMQQSISRSLLSQEVGRELSVLIEETGVEGTAIGRSYHFAPEVDGVFVVTGAERVKPGNLVRVQVTGSDVYDLYGVFSSHSFTTV